MFAAYAVLEASPAGWPEVGLAAINMLQAVLLAYLAVRAHRDKPHG